MPANIAHFAPVRGQVVQCAAAHQHAASVGGLSLQNCLGGGAGQAQRWFRRDERAQPDGGRPAQRLDQQRAGVGANAEERRGGQREVARGAAEQRPARRERDVHQAGERHGHGELAGEAGQRDGPAGEAEEDQQVADEELS